MKEIGGYIELDRYRGSLLHENALALNCGRNCLAYLIESKKIKKICLPYFLCDSVRNVCDKSGVDVRYYHIDKNFLPVNVSVENDEWLYVVNYYGQVSKNKILDLKKKFKRIIVDQAQAYFDMPADDSTDTLYTCRKFFGVSDGAFLYTDVLLKDDLAVDQSFDRMNFLLGRFERTASEFYKEYADNNHRFTDEPIKKMSALTLNLLHGIDYEYVRNRRTENFQFLHDQFKDINNLELTVPDGAFMYPLYIKNGADIRKRLLDKKIYIPTLWPDVFNTCNTNDLEYDMAANILPLPVDQRYDNNDMEFIVKEIIKCIN